MTLDPRTPVLVGAATVEQRLDDPAAAREAATLMADAAREAAADAGAADLLAAVDRILVPKGFWDYPDPGRLVGEAVGAADARTTVAEIGILQTSIVGRAARTIADGGADVVLVVGGEAKHRARRAQAAGTEAATTPQPGARPDEVWRPAADILHPLEIGRGLAMPVAQYAVMENALRAAEGLDVAAHRAEVADLWARFSAIAAANPHAWSRDAVSAAEIAGPSERNRMLAFPYTKLHNSQWNVDQAGALLLCSLSTARRHGVADDRLLFPCAVTESNHMVPLVERRDLHRSPGFALAGARALDLAGVALEDVARLDLYSCFPVAVRVQVRELGVDPARDLTVTGGMAFAGGPLNNYVLQALPRLREALLAEPGAVGIATAVSGMLTKQGVSVWSTEPPPAGFATADVADEVAAATPTVAVVDDPVAGPATIASYTVTYEGDEPSVGIALCDLPDGARTIVTTTDADVATDMTRSEWCGRSVDLLPGAGFAAG